MKVVFCLPIWRKPYAVTVAALEASLPLIEAAGHTHGLVQILDNPYISAARATMLRAALDEEPDAIVFIDYDLSWQPKDLLKLIETNGDVVAGTYRCRLEDEHYMGVLECDADGRPKVRRGDGAILASIIPAGFMKITRDGVDKFMVAYPELCYGPMYHLSVDLFNHGVHERLWWGEDYSFARRWREKCGDIWIVPDIDLNHHREEKDGSVTVYEGNYHKYLIRECGTVEPPIDVKYEVAA